MLGPDRRRTPSTFSIVQRCGCDVPGWHKACHLDDAKLADGTHVDVTGGWHSAGDYNKPMWQFGDSGVKLCPGHGVCRPAAGCSAASIATRRGLADALDEALVGRKFLAKMQDAGRWLDARRRDARARPHLDGLEGARRTHRQQDRHGRRSGDRARGRQCAADDCGLGQRRPGAGRPRRFERLRSAGRAAVDFFDAAGFGGRQSAAAHRRHRAGPHHARTTSYRQFARRSVQALLATQKPSGAMRGDTGDHGDVAAAALALFALAYADDPLHDDVVAALRRYLDFCIARRDNPFGLSRQGTEEPEATFFHPTVGMGVNFWILSRAWAALLIASIDARPPGAWRMPPTRSIGCWARTR